MFKNYEDPLKSSFSMTDTFQVGILFDGQEEIMPIEVDFEEIFYDLIDIKTEVLIPRNAELVINMHNDEVMYNISGTVIRISELHGLYCATIKIEALPTELFNELIGMMKEAIGDIKEK